MKDDREKLRRLAEKHGAWERVGLSLLPGKELRALVCELDCDKDLLEDAAALVSAVPALLSDFDRLEAEYERVRKALAESEKERRGTQRDLEEALRDGP